MPGRVRVTEFHRAGERLDRLLHGAHCLAVLAIVDHHPDERGPPLPGGEGGLPQHLERGAVAAEDRKRTWRVGATAGEPVARPLNDGLAITFRNEGNKRPADDVVDVVAGQGGKSRIHVAQVAIEADDHNPRYLLFDQTLELAVALRDPPLA